MRLSWRKVSAFACIFFFSLSSLCAKKKAAEAQPEYVANPSDAVKLSLPEKRNTSYFRNVEKSVLDNVEKGTPESLSSAITYLKRRRESMSESEQVLHYIAVSIMQVCWKSQNLTEETSGQFIKNNYTGAITSSRNGFYDSFPSPDDFFSYMLPSLVLAASETRSDYYEDSFASLTKALELRPDSLPANYLMGLLLRRMSDFKGANKYFARAYEIDKNCFECAYAYADSFVKLNDYDSAFSLAEDLLSLYPQKKELLALCAESSFSAGNFDSAEVYVGRLLQIEPENSYYLLFRARILVKRGEYIRAASLLDAYARKDSDSRDYLVLRFTVQKNWNKNLSAARSTIEKALVLYPDDEEIILEAAELASETGEKIAEKSGEELADQILEKRPGDSRALQIKIASMVQNKKWAAAYKASSELLKMENLPRSALFTHIQICLSAGRKDEAWRYASNLYAEDSTNEEVLQSYIDVLVSTGRTKEASRLIAQLLPNASAKLKSFLYYERSFISGGESAILADLRSSLTANPRNKDSLFRLYRIYYNKKEYRKAQYYLKQVVALSSKDEYLLGLNKELEDILKRN